MNFGEILDRIAQMGPRDPNVARRPAAELVAFFVRWSRSLLQWKQQTLASFAGVSLSTVERVERAERVSEASLDRIAGALGHEPGYLTSPRLPLGQDKAIGRFVEIFGGMEPVPVRRIRTEAQIRHFSLCHGCLIHRHVEVDTEHDALISELWEWFDLGSFMIGCSDICKPSGETRRRQFYGNVLDCVRRLEKSGLNVLGGVMHAPQAGIPDWKVAVISVTPKSIDPGAAKRRHVLVDRRYVEAPPNWPSRAVATQ